MSVIRFPPVDLRQPMATKLNVFQRVWRRWFGRHNRATVTNLRKLG